MLDQTLIEISGQSLSAGDVMKIVTLVLTIVIAYIVVFNFLGDRPKIKFNENFSKRRENGIETITGIRLRLVYTGKGSMIIDNVGIAYKEGEHLYPMLAQTINKDQPFNTNRINDMKVNDDIRKILESGQYVYFLETGTGKRHWLCDSWEKYRKIGKTT